MNEPPANLKLRTIELQRFRGFRVEARITLVDGLNVLVGDNGAGKSSVCNAIEWCLFGRTVESKVSGITEYMNREIKHRAAGDEPTRVVLLFEGRAGEVRVSRTRAADAKVKSPDDRLEVVDAAGVSHLGDDADLWLADNGFPGWADWRACFCQHQEDARYRLLDGASLKSSLAALLGLEELVELRSRLDEVKLTTHIRAVKRVEAQQNEALLELATAPGPVDEAAAACERLGVDPATVTRDTALAEGVQLLDAARALAAELGIDQEVPVPPKEPGDLLTWATSWPTVVRSQKAKYSRLPDLRQAAGEVDALIGEVAPLGRLVDEAQTAVHSAVAEGGDADQRQVALDQAKEAADRAQAERKAASTLHSLLSDAAGVIQDHPDDPCPVCETQVAGLADQVQARLETLSTEVTAALDETLKRTNQTARDAHQASAALADLAGRLDDAHTRLEGRTRALRSHLPDPEVTDPLAAARTVLEQIHSNITTLEPLLQTRDEALETHRVKGERLAVMVRYVDALERQSTRVDVTTLDAWQEYQRSVDELVDLIVDCEALSSHANDLLRQRSEERLSVVNRSLGKHFAAITGEAQAAARGMIIQTKTTPKKVSYLVQGGDGRDLLPVLNQASLNGLALAILCAQAADRLARGGPAILVLDDPEQNLDSEHIAGLARLLEQMTSAAPILVAAPPGRLVDRIRDFASCAKSFIRLEPWDPRRGAALSDRSATPETAPPETGS